MKLKRGSGILLHLTSLPGKYGIGDMGQEAYHFIDFLEDAGQKYWQILPLNPVGYGESPYQSFSAFAANPLLISIDELYEEGLLVEEDLQDVPDFNDIKVEFSKVKEFKEKLFRIASERFKSRRYPDFLKYKEKNSIWLENYTLFMALKKHFGGIPWNHWYEPIANRNTQALRQYQILLQEEIEYNNFLQFIFYMQWMKLKRYANGKGIQIIGDLPIFISYDSSDVWANPHLFELDADGNPLKVAGVPPDYFSETGQLWGNPHYKWSEMAKDDYQWWRERFKCLLQMVDIIRIDHFRGFEAYWEIPAGEETTVNGRWVKGPGAEFFSIMEKYLGELPVIAEDLGIITPLVEELKNQFNFPGMQVLQFIFEDTSQEITLPLKFAGNSVVYTGTHDNDTLWGWFTKHYQEKTGVVEYLKEKLNLDYSWNCEQICWQFIKIALESNAILAIIPLQDLLCLDSSARMNYPGTLGGNWEWRFKKGVLTKELQLKLLNMVEASKR